MGLDAKMVELITGCVLSATFSVLINGIPKGHIIPSRGLRQGNPLSPYLFLLCTEGLINLLSNTQISFVC